MPNEKNKRIMLTEMFGGIDNLLKTAVTQDEVKELLDMVAGFIKRLETKVTEKLAENKAEISTETARLGSQVADFEKRLREIVGTKESDINKNIDTLVNELRAEIGYVESLVNAIEDYDDTEVRGMVEEVRGAIPEMPEKYDPTDMLERLEELVKKYEKLDKNVKGIQGSMSVPTPMMRPLHEAFTMDGATSTVTLNQAIAADGTAAWVRENGQALDLTTQYTVDGTTITLIDTPISGTIISVTYFPWL